MKLHQTNPCRYFAACETCASYVGITPRTNARWAKSRWSGPNKCLAIDSDPTCKCIGTIYWTGSYWLGDVLCLLSPICVQTLLEVSSQEHCMELVQKTIDYYLYELLPDQS